MEEEWSTVHKEKFVYVYSSRTMLTFCDFSGKSRSPFKGGCGRRKSTQYFSVVVVSQRCSHGSSENPDSDSGSSSLAMCCFI